jgi:hypothetical protein
MATEGADVRRLGGARDVGRRWTVFKTLMVSVELTDDDVREQMEAGETAEDSIRHIAAGMPLSAWEVLEIEYYDEASKESTTDLYGVN